MGLRLRYPPLSCRTSPPQGGRSTRGWTIASYLPCRSRSARIVWGSHSPRPISPLVGEMSGRTEGGIPGTTPDILPKRRLR
ncbi:hypothetical protein GFL86_28905 [Rhizobium laguerreae]|nr:hypothetical protein [Rhizobium laguerreae]